MMMQRNRFEGQVALITGGGKGIGRAAASMMGAEGARIVLVERDRAVLDEAIDALRREGVSAMGLAADALIEHEVQRAVEAALQACGAIDILVNGVGGSTVGGKSTALLETMTLGEFEAMLRFNLSGTFLFCRAVIPSMKSRRAGRIVNIASIAARGTAFSNAAYSAAKAGVVSLTTKLALELAPHGIFCNAIAPGLTLTDRMEAAMKDFSAEELARRAAQVPLGRFSTPADQARAICFLASRDADFITGSTLFVTGGA
jgi:NAD(P)-dependent dehydrogenase (short-subunit alcohol dehydrogenase family)